MESMRRLQGKIAFVQGGSRGIGAAIVKRLAQDGAAVAFTYISSGERADKVAAEITNAGGKAIAIQADSADPNALQEAIRQTVAHFGGLDILVNSAGVLSWGPAPSPGSACPPDRRDSCRYRARRPDPAVR